MKFYCRTHKGQRRGNEDSIRADGFYAVVADGMGGHNAGDVASSITVNRIKSCFENKSASDITAKDIKKAIWEANKAVWVDARLNPERKGMGSTVTIAVFKNNKVFVGQVGDSRAYIYSGGNLKQITKDHSYVQELIDAGHITDKEASFHPKKNIITRAVGTNIDLNPDFFAVDTNPGDIVLLCTDGLNSCISDEEIAAMLSSEIETSADRLISAALDCGSEDNISVIIAVVEGEAL